MYHAARLDASGQPQQIGVSGRAFCIAAMRAAFWMPRIWDFHADALTPCNVSGRVAQRTEPQEQEKGEC
jgi:hypothetical protein